MLDELSRIRIARLHWRVGEALERDDASRFGEIAFHYAAGSDVGDAATVVRTALDAGDDALQRLAFDEAAHHFQTALAAMERTAADVELRDRVLRGLGTALNATAQLDEAKPLWLQVADLALQAGDPERLFTAILGYGYVIRIDDDTELVRLLDELLDLLGPGDSPIRASALGWRAMPGGTVGVGGDAERASHPATTRRRTDGERSRRDGASNGKRSGDRADAALRVSWWRPEAPTPTACCATPRSTSLLGGLELLGRRLETTTGDSTLRRPHRAQRRCCAAAARKASRGGASGGDGHRAR